MKDIEILRIVSNGKSDTRLPEEYADDYNRLVKKGLLRDHDWVDGYYITLTDEGRKILNRENGES